LAKACEEDNLATDNGGQHDSCGLREAVVCRIDSQFMDALADRIADRLVARLSAPPALNHEAANSSSPPVPSTGPGLPSHFLVD
jgi:hypothetical protein